MRILAVSALALVIHGAVLAGRMSDQIPAQFTNLQVLSKDMPRAELVGVMKQFCFDLGVRCEHCHVGEGNDLSQFDFAADARPAKATARRMLRMVAMLRTEFFAAGTSAPADPKVTCYTCHRGAVKPLTQAPEGGGGATN
jgi:Photosynthetic reaction centre cytochrome C subunit